MSGTRLIFGCVVCSIGGYRLCSTVILSDVVLDSVSSLSCFPSVASVTDDERVFCDGPLVFIARNCFGIGSW